MFSEIDQNIIWESNSPSSRETLYLAKDNAPLLNRHYSIWKEGLRSLEPEFVLADLLHYLRTTLFNLSLCNKSTVDELVKQAGTQMVPIEFFVQQKTGVCRHFALVAYYFFEKMGEEGQLPISSVDLTRAFVSVEGHEGRHAWVTLFMDHGKRSFHFDPFWGIIIDMSNPLAQETLNKAYGFQKEKS